MDNPKYQEALKYGRYTGNIPRKLRLHKRKMSALLFPRGFVKTAQEICSRHGVEPRLLDYRTVQPEIDFEFKGELRDYQQQAVNDILKDDTGVLEASTGSGKTVMALAVIAARKQPTLVIVHTKELLQQWQDRIKSFLGITPGQIGAGKFDVQPITAALVQTLRKRTGDIAHTFGHVIVDECHRTPTATFSECVTENWGKYLLGLSATPFRRDGLTKYIHVALGDRSHQVDPDMLREAGSVLSPELEVVKTDFQYDYQDDYQDMVSELVRNYNRNKLITREIELEFNRRDSGSILVVSDRLEHLQLLHDISGPGSGKAILTGSTPARERERIVQDLAAGKVKILFSTLSLIGEGFDAPGLDRLLLATPIKFEGRLVQVVGRILRPAEGKRPLIIDFQDTKQPILRAQARERTKVFEEVLHAKIKRLDWDRPGEVWSSCPTPRFRPGRI